MSEPLEKLRALVAEVKRGCHTPPSQVVMSAWATRIFDRFRVRMGLHPWTDEGMRYAKRRRRQARRRRRGW